MKIAVLHNPKAGERDPSRKDLLRLLRAAGYRPEYFSLKEDAWKKRDALRDAEFVVVAGGDGSVRKAALHFGGSDRPLALLPLGTANNICGSLGIAGELEEIVAGWRKARRARLDLGIARGPWGERRFVEGVGVGLIGRTIDVLSAVSEAGGGAFRRRKHRLQHDANVVAALAHELRPVEVTMALDGRRAKTNDYLLLEILNIARAGPRLELAPGADATDGYFDVVMVRAHEREKLMRHLASHLAGRRRPFRLERCRACAVRLEIRGGEFRLDDRVLANRPPVADKRVHRAGRGDPPQQIEAPSLQVEIALEPRRVEVLLPAGAGRK